MKKKLRKKIKGKSGKISRIEKQKRGKKYNLYLDDSFVLSVYEETLLEFSLRKETELSEEDISKIQEFDAKTKAYNYAYDLLSIRPRSSNELRERLFKKFSPFVAKLIVSDLQKKGQVSDEEFCRFWVGLACRKLKSKRQIRFELYQKKVDGSKIEEVLEEIDRKQETDKAQKLVDKFAKRYKEISKVKQNIKLKQMLIRRGFDWEVVNSIFRP